MTSDQINRSRQRRIPLTENLLYGLLTGRLRVVDMPADIEVVGSAYDMPTRCAWVYVRHLSFAPVEVGQIIPEHHVMVRVAESESDAPQDPMRARWGMFIKGEAL